MDSANQYPQHDGMHWSVRPGRLQMESHNRLSSDTRRYTRGSSHLLMRFVIRPIKRPFLERVVHLPFSTFDLAVRAGI